MVFLVARSHICLTIAADINYHMLFIMKPTKSISVRLKRAKNPKSRDIMISEWVDENRTLIQENIEKIKGNLFTSQTEGFVQIQKLLIKLDKKFLALHNIFEIIRTPQDVNAFKSALLQSDEVRINGKAMVFSLDGGGNNTLDKGVVIGDIIFSVEELLTAKRENKVWYIVKDHTEYSVECLKLMKI